MNRRPTNDAMHAAWPELEIWQSECSGGTWQADPFRDTARLVLNGWNHWENASLLWNLALDPSHGPHLGGCGTCRGVVTIDPPKRRWTFEPDFAVLAAASRSARPGAHVLSTTVTNAADLVASAVCDARGRATVVSLNPGAARRVTISAGDRAFRTRLAADALTTIRAPRLLRCG